MAPGRNRIRRIGLLEQVRVRPVPGAGAAVEQAGLGQEERARAHGGHQRAAGVHAPKPLDLDAVLAAGRRVGRRVHVAHDHGVDLVHLGDGRVRLDEDVPEAAQRLGRGRHDLHVEQDVGGLGRRHVRPHRPDRPEHVVQPVQDGGRALRCDKQRDPRSSRGCHFCPDPVDSASSSMPDGRRYCRRPRAGSAPGSLRGEHHDAGRCDAGESPRRRRRTHPDRRRRRLRRSPARLERHDRPSSERDRPGRRRGRRRAGDRAGPAVRVAAGDPRRRPQRGGQRHGGRRDPPGHGAPQRRRGRSRCPPRPRGGRSHAPGRRSRDRAVRARGADRRGVRDWDRRPHPRRRRRLARPALRPHDRQPRLGGCRPGDRGAGHGERDRSPGPALGAARRRRQLRRGDLLHLPGPPAGPRRRSRARSSTSAHGGGRRWRRSRRSPRSCPTTSAC